MTEQELLRQSLIENNVKNNRSSLDYYLPAERYHKLMEELREMGCVYSETNNYKPNLDPNAVTFMTGGLTAQIYKQDNP